MLSYNSRCLEMDSMWVQSCCGTHSPLNDVARPRHGTACTILQLLSSRMYLSNFILEKKLNTPGTKFSNRTYVVSKWEWVERELNWKLSGSFLALSLSPTPYYYRPLSIPTQPSLPPTHSPCHSLSQPLPSSSLPLRTLPLFLAFTFSSQPQNCQSTHTYLSLSSHAISLYLFIHFIFHLSRPVALSIHFLFLECVRKNLSIGGLSATCDTCKPKQIKYFHFKWNMSEYGKVGGNACEL